MTATRAHWLRDRLLWRLMLPLLLIVAATAAMGAYSAQQLTDRVFDRWLIDAAQSLAQQVHVERDRATLDLPPAAEAVLLYDEVDRVTFAVLQHGVRVLGREDVPAAGTREAVYRSGRAFDAMLGGRSVRVASVDVPSGAQGPIVVLVAETTIKRQRAQQNIVAMLWPMALLLVAAAVAIGLAVRLTIRPLEWIAARWSAHAHASLQPIGVDDVPRELVPFAHALNGLLERMRAMLARERAFASNAAHQLRTPLASLQLGLARAAEAPDLDSTRAVLRDLGEVTQRTARVVQQLLTLSRLDPEVAVDLALAPVDLVELAREIGEAYFETAQRKHITLELVHAHDRVVVPAQGDLLSEALGNLIDNAVRYSPPGARVAIVVGTDPPSIAVEDTGPGIAAEERERIFERFVRGRASPGEGSGLGLAIVRQIADAHRASVALTDTSQGGACVTIRFDQSQA